MNLSEVYGNGPGVAGALALSINGQFMEDLHPDRAELKART